MSGRASNTLRALTSRRDWLVKQIAERNGSEGSLGHAAAELDALEWVLPIVDEMVWTNRTQARDVHRQRLETAWRTTALVLARYLYDDDRDEWDRLVAKAHPIVADQLRTDVERRALTTEGDTNVTPL